MTVTEHHSAQELWAWADQEKRAKVALRLRAVAMAQEGEPGAEIADQLGTSLRSVDRWVRRYNAEGVHGLLDRPRPGQPTKLTREQEAALCQHLSDGPADDDPRSVWHGRDLQRIIEQEFGVLYSLSGIYQLLHRLNYSWLVPRPQHEQADPEAQEVFKKTYMSR